MALILLGPLLETPKLEGKEYNKMLQVFELLSSFMMTEPFLVLHCLHNMFNAYVVC